VGRERRVRGNMVSSSEMSSGVGEDISFQGGEAMFTNGNVVEGTRKN
jgi:hypothetical protein